MGRFLLIALLATALGACGPAEEAAYPHADLACAACHSGSQGERGRATVPAASCTASGCHESGGPDEVRLSTVTFPHRGHAEDSEIEPSCAGCHTHETGEEPLRASVEACALCHVADVNSAAADECRTCHEQPDHSSLTSQGVAVSHSQLPWIDIGCVRCHYDVAEAETDVAGVKCSHCHDDLSVLNERAVGRDLHPIHEGLTCTACHTKGLHEVQAMSSAVELICSDCHREAHDTGLQLAQRSSTELCAACHSGVHAAQQRLLLGIRPDGGTMPSAKFLAGITCRSCHVPPEAANGQPSEAIRGQATACAGCHESEYTQVLDWWIEGAQARHQDASRYVEQAVRTVGTRADSASALLETAREMLQMVRDAGAQHNLELSDRLIRQAVERADQAYQVSGVAAPVAPDLGRVPHAGMCSYCHYGADEPWDFEAMPDDFHRSVLTPDE